MRDQVRNEVGMIPRHPACPRPPSPMTTGAEGKVGKHRTDGTLEGPHPSLSMQMGSLRAFKPNETLIHHCLLESWPKCPAAQRTEAAQRDGGADCFKLRANSPSPGSFIKKKK